ncbi:MULTISPECIES: hypothetical protein [Clostridium]|uniref:hypothetical protein n=1 Tax=Clostridium TaxID=1485 RepID=UPI00069EF29B|nr:MULTISPECIES: hypothetical protein [Clostridium]KOF57837.1 hypothetical protein AGR56_16675 [Clostridium sp. DMHC 10]MCD2345064.1 zinc ribbon domain-containing protein [Clostridium guangxiense]
MQEKLIKLWKTCETKQLAKIFEEYMKSIDIKKYDGRRKNNDNTYIIDGKSTNWNRVQCFYHKGSTSFGHENLLFVLRKESGNYFIIERESVRAFECDHNGVIEYNEKLLDEIIKEHKPLFDTLLSMIS